MWYSSFRSWGYVHCRWKLHPEHFYCFAWNLYFPFYETNSYDIFITKCVVVSEPGGRITSCYQAEDIDSPNSNRLKVTRSQGKAVRLILSEYATARVEISLLNMLYWYYNINIWTANRSSNKVPLQIIPFLTFIIYLSWKIKSKHHLLTHF